MMITKENYIEIGHVECNECKASLDWDTVDNAIRKYGLISLSKESDGSAYFGYTCPRCANTTLHISSIEFLQFLTTGNLTNPEGIKPHPKGAHYLGYLPSPLQNGKFNYGIEKALLIPNQYTNYAMNSCFENSAYFVFVQKVKKSLSECSAILSNYYCSLLSDTIAIGPIPKIEYFVNYGTDYKKLSNAGLQIKRYQDKTDEFLLSYNIWQENSYGIKSFNRYVLIDPIYSLINEFNMKFGTRFATLSFIARNFPDDDWLTRRGLPFDLKPMDKIVKAQREKHVMMFKKDPQLNLMKNINFLNTICIPDIDYYIAYQRENKDYRTLYPTHGMSVDFSELKQIYRDIWSKFHNKSLQELLRIMSDNFLDGYFDLVERSDCSFETIWGLRHKYLLTIHDSIKSAFKMNQKKQDEVTKYFEKIRLLSAPYPSLQRIITQNYDMLQIKETLIQIGKSQSIDSFLLLGETGTGKELFAKAIHEISGRSGAFIPINCAAIPEQMFEAEFFGHTKGAFTGANYDKVGFFEQADGGTIFLDEIGELDSRFQARLLRVLQEKEITPVGGKIKKVDFLLVSATNRDLRRMIDAGQFREDLYQRINEYIIPILSLSERKDDIPLLAKHFIEKFDTAINEDPSIKSLTIENETLEFLENHNWRGNVRELERACKLVLPFRKPGDRSDVTISEFNLEEVPTAYTNQTTSKKYKKKPSGLKGNTRVTSDQVKQAMENNGGNKTKAAKELDVTYHTILRHCKKLGI